MDGEDSRSFAAWVLGPALVLMHACTPRPPSEVKQTTPLTTPVWRCQASAPTAPGPSCDALPSYQRRLTYDLTASERAVLVSQLRILDLRNHQHPSTPLEHWDFEHIVIAQVRGCEISILTECRGVGRYQLMPRRDEPQRQELSTPEELWSNLPRYAAGERRPVIVEHVERGGMYVKGTVSPRDLELTGACSSATHAVFGVTLGAGTLSTNSGELVAVGDPRGCAAMSDLEALARGGCLEPLQIRLVPLGEHAHLSEPCLAPARWTTGLCRDTKVHPLEPCIDPALPSCRPPGDDSMFEHAPTTLDADQLWSSLGTAACQDYVGKYELTIDGPTGRVTEVCGAGAEFAAAAQILTTQLPTTREPDQRHTLSCFGRKSQPGD